MKKHDYSILKSVSIVLLSLVVLILIFAIFIKIDDYQAQFYKIDVRFKTNDTVELTNKLPLSDTIGKNYNGEGVEKGIAEFKEFTIKNPNKKKIDYEIYLTKLPIDTKDIRSNYIKLYLTDAGNNPIEGFDTKKVKEYYDLYAFENKPGSKLLYKGSLSSGKKKKFILRSWVADTYILSDEEEGFKYNIDVRIK